MRLVYVKERVESSYLCDTDKDVGCLLLQQLVERTFPGLLEKVVFDGNERGFSEALEGQNHSIGQQAVHQDPAHMLSITIMS